MTAALCNALLPDSLNSQLYQGFSYKSNYRESASLSMENSNARETREEKETEAKTSDANFLVYVAAAPCNFREAQVQ
jgi:hypothetical protein